MTVAQHRLAVRDEHHLDGQVEQRPQPGAQVVLRVAAEVAQPRLRAHAEPWWTIAEDPVTGDECTVLRDPEDSLARTRDLESFDTLGHRGRGVVAPGQPRAASLVPFDGDENRYAILGRSSLVEWTFTVAGGFISFVAIASVSLRYL